MWPVNVLCLYLRFHMHAPVCDAVALLARNKRFALESIYFMDQQSRLTTQLRSWIPDPRMAKINTEARSQVQGVISLMRMRNMPASFYTHQSAPQLRLRSVATLVKV